MATVMNNLSTQLLVIGGGATGLGIAWDASLRGIKTVLVEKGDLGEGTSGRYHGLLHSGGRYVISDPHSASDCASENEILRKIAPSTIEDTGGYFVSTPADPLEFPDSWLHGCEQTGVAADEIPLAQLRKREPLLNPRISRAFSVNDGALDSFALTHLLANGIQRSGGKLLLRHAVTGLEIRHNHIQTIQLINLRTQEMLMMSADFVINAAGPWAGDIAWLAKTQIPITLSKGSMLAMASRFTQTVINRCKPPGDGDILVPIGTVSVLGTTDLPVQRPDHLQIFPWELDLLLSEADILVPGIRQHRPLRAWAGVRPLYSSQHDDQEGDRAIKRSHIVLDHRDRDGIDNFVSVFGGKLTTYRLMAEAAVDLAANRLGQYTACATRTTPIPAPDSPIGFLGSERLRSFSDRASSAQDMVICECELVSAKQLRQALFSDEQPTLDDLRRDFRLGMGPCQAAYCGFRSAGIAAKGSRADPQFLGDFTQERWKGIQPLVWGSSLRQIELMRRINFELLHLSEADQ
ncbi:MAG: anaerobic glycerol-3-phosphate dehydrogenase subunit A [Anaerolineales bacterium]|nr:MAG: anaerobic glycerol-3-phosphate dehydrogenase subunit A [Anaerolineales bacterium]